MFQPARHSEIETYVGYTATQIDGLREAAYGLTEEQARLTPCRSGLSIGGLLKHATYVLHGHLHDGEVDRSAPLEEAGRLFAASFALSDDESLADAVERFDDAASRYLAQLGGTDPDAEAMDPPAPWFGRPEPTPVHERFQILHVIEELARHAGHADIIREQIDGATAMPLHLAATGSEGNAFGRPWRPGQA